MKARLVATFMLTAGWAWSRVWAAPEDYFAIRVVDEQTGRGVPLVQLETVNRASWWTDSQGWIAFDEPGLTDQDVFFHVRSHGYLYPKDFFGFHGVKLRPTRGGSATIRLQRLNIAERLYRVTGEGIYRDSVQLGRAVPIRWPLLNGQVMGQDTVIATPYRGRIHWGWGDTERVGYPLGNFGASGATSEWPGRGGLDPAVGVDLTYFVDAAGFSRPMCPLPTPGLRWIECLLNVRDEQGVERLVARVANMRDLDFAHDWHLMQFDDEEQVFKSVQRWDLHEGHDSAHPFRARIDGVAYFYLYPNWRVRADLASLRDLEQYEALTCVAGDGRAHGAATAIQRDDAGRPRYVWKAGADRLHAGRMDELRAAGKLRPEERWIQLHDLESGARVADARGSVCWNVFRQRWVMLVSAKAGEIWFAEGDTPVGPWVYARRVVAHDAYNFYNPTQHAFFDQEGGRLIYFEGTYTAAFSDAREKTPRYDYNQIMYRLALDDPRLVLPAPVYCLQGTDGRIRYATREGLLGTNEWAMVKGVSFFAVPPVRSPTGFVPVFATVQEGHQALQAALSSESGHGARPLFYALPAAIAPVGASLSGRWRCVAKGPDGGELEFALELIQRGTNVAGVQGGDTVEACGSIDRGNLTLSVAQEGHTYQLQGMLGERQITGTWTQADGDARGTWSAAWVRSSPGEDDTPAIAFLYEYAQQDGQRIYSTDVALTNPGLKRRAEAVCRVWKNQMAVLVLDPQAVPESGF